MTGSSGPGVALKTEAIGWAVMAEVPLIICDIQRGGPSTGMPTSVEQSDLNMAVFGGHGDAPRVVLAPGSVEDCFLHCVLEAAKNCAEASTTYLFSFSAINRLRRELRRLKSHPLKNFAKTSALTFSPVNDYTPHPLSGEIQPRVVLGDNANPQRQILIATGFEHDEMGHPTGSPKCCAMQMTARRRRKPEKTGGRLKLPKPQTDGAPEGNVLLVRLGNDTGADPRSRGNARAAGQQCFREHMRHLLYASAAERFGGYIRGVQRGCCRFEMNDRGPLRHRPALAEFCAPATRSPKIRDLNKTDYRPDLARARNPGGRQEGRRRRELRKHSANFKNFQRPFIYEVKLQFRFRNEAILLPCRDPRDLAKAS